MGIKKRRYNADLEAVEKCVIIFYKKRVVKITFLTPTVDFVRKIFRGQVILAHFQRLGQNVNITTENSLGLDSALYQKICKILAPYLKVL
jgi:hypothetical protein